MSFISGLRPKSNFLAKKSLILLLALLSSVSATDYYVAASGNDSYAGTQAAPWQTLARVSAASLNAGDRVFLNGGDDFAAPLAINRSGSSAAPIIIDSYGTGRAVIRSSAAGTQGITWANNSYVTMQNLQVVGPGYTVSTVAGIDAYLYGASRQQGISIINLDVSGFASAIRIGSWANGTGMDGLLVDGCALHDNRDGLFLFGETITDHINVTIRRCLAYNNHGNPDTTTTPNGSSILVSGVSNCLIENCLVRDCGDLGGGGVGIWAYGADQVTIQYCEVYNQKAAHSGDGGGFDLDGGVSNSVIQYCYSHDNDGAGYLVYQYGGALASFQLNANNVVRYNVSKNDGRRRSYAGIVVGSGSAAELIQGCDFYNNTIYNATECTDGSSQCINLGSNYSGIRVRNNQFIAGNGRTCLISTTAATEAQALFQGNLYVATAGATLAINWGGTTYSTLSAWRSATVQETSGATLLGLQADPMLSNPGGAGNVATTLADAQTLDVKLSQLDNFTPPGNSPVVDAGLDLTSPTWGSLTVGTRDFLGARLPQGAAYDIGAVEVVLSTNAAPTVATAAAASPSPVTGTTTALSVLGADDDGEAALIYTWAATGTPPAAVTFSANGTNAAKMTTATFTKTGSYNFQVTIKDAGNLTVTSAVSVPVNQTPPTITVPAGGVTVEATGPSGATATFTTSAVDNAGNAVATVNSPVSGSNFQLGNSTVTVTATDSFERTATATFIVTVGDTTPPAITVPATITRNATTATGACVTYSTSASDLVSGNVPTINTPATGSFFPIGNTTVTASTTDLAGNSGSRTFLVNVVVPPVSLAELVTPPPAISGSSLNFTIESTVPGRTYQLQRSDNLSDGSWINIGTVHTGSGGSLNLSDGYDPAAKVRFYRLRLGP